MNNNAIAQNPIAVQLWRPSVIVGLVYLALLVVLAVLYDYRAIDFVHLGTVWGKHDPGGTWGYDGQFYYQIAVNPFGAAEFMDNAPFRYQRIVYPLLARFMALGRPELIPYTLLLVNWLSIVLSVELLSIILKTNQLSPWFSLGYGLYFGHATALTFDTTEPFALFLVTLGIWLWSRERPNWAALSFGIASLARETSVLFPLGFVAYFLTQTNWKEITRFVALSIAPLLCWLVTIWLVFGETGTTFTPPFERVPFYGIFFHVDKPRMFWLLIILIFIPTIMSGIIASAEFLRKQWHPILFAWLANIVMITFMARYSYMELISCSRVSLGLVLACVTFGASIRSKSILQFSLYYALTFIIYMAGVLLGIKSLIL